MSTITISLWFNENDAQETEFANGFTRDLTKCLSRFLPTYKVEFLNNKDHGHRNFRVVSKSKNEIAEADVKDSYKYTVLQIEPTDSTNLNQSGLASLFWDKQFETGEVRLFRRDSVETKAKYWEKVTDLAIEVSGSLNPSQTKGEKPKVYLSVDDVSYNADRENIKRDFSDLGYDVLPSQQLSRNMEECAKQIENAIEQCDIVVHIIPPIYEIHFIESHMSLTELQCNVSAKMLAEKKTKANRIIWIPSAYEVTDEENQIFIEKIQRDQEQTLRTVVLKSSIEDLKKYYRTAITGEISREKDEVDVYIIADSTSTENEVKQALNGLKLRTPSDIKGITFTQHLQELANAKSVVICYTNRNKKWLAVKANDILKSKGIDAAKHFNSVILLKGNMSLDTKDFEHIFTMVLDKASNLAQIIKQNSNTLNISVNG